MICQLPSGYPAPDIRKAMLLQQPEYSWRGSKDIGTEEIRLVVRNSVLRIVFQVDQGILLKILMMRKADMPQLMHQGKAHS